MRNILVVDDDKLILFGLSRAFERRGFGVTTAGTAGQGLFLLNSMRFDLCLLDSDLPDANGLDLMEAILEKRPALPIVMMAAGKLCESDRFRLTGAVEEGRCCFMRKPFNRHEMLELVAQTMQEKPQPEPFVLDIVNTTRQRCRVSL